MNPPRYFFQLFTLVDGDSQPYPCAFDGGFAPPEAGIGQTFIKAPSAQPRCSPSIGLTTMGAPPRRQRLGGALPFQGPRKYVSTFFMSPVKTGSL